MNINKLAAVPIEFGGQSRKLIFDFNALAELEDQARTFTSKTPVRKLLRASLWAGMIRDTLDRDGQPTERTLSLLDVGDILDTCKEQWPALMAAVAKAQGIALPEPGPGPQMAQGAGESAEAPTTSSSGPSLESTSDSPTESSGD